MLESYSRVWTSQQRRQERGNRYRHGRRSTRSRHTRRGGSRGLRSGLCAPSESQGPRPQGMGEGRCAQQPPRAAAARRSVAAADEKPSPQHTLPLGLKTGGEEGGRVRSAARSSGGSSAFVYARTVRQAAPGRRPPARPGPEQQPNPAPAPLPAARGPLCPGRGRKRLRPPAARRPLSFSNRVPSPREIRLTNRTMIN